MYMEPLFIRLARAAEMTHGYHQRGHDLIVLGEFEDNEKSLNRGMRSARDHCTHADQGIDGRLGRMAGEHRVQKNPEGRPGRGPHEE